MCGWSGQWLQQAALGWVVYEITGSGALLGAVMGVRAIPILLLTPLSGVAADRYDRKRLLFGSQLLAAAVSLAFGAALALHLVNTWMLFVFTMLMGASNVIDRPARLSTAFDLVPRDVAVKAVALNTVGFSLTRIFAPAAAGYLIAWFGAAGSFFVQGVLYGASGLVALMVVFPPRRRAQPGRSALAHIGEGLRFAAGDPSVRLIMVLAAVPYFLLVPTWGILLPIFAKDEFATGPEGLGMMLTAVGLGGTLGGLVANALSRVERQGVLQAAWILVMAAALAGLAASRNFPLALFFALLGGAAEMAHTASNMAMLQLSAPDAMRGRVASLTMLYPIFISAGAFVSGPLADLLGVRGASYALAGAAGGLTLILFCCSTRLRELRL